MKIIRKIMYYILYPFVFAVYCFGRGLYFISQIIRSIAFLATFNPNSALDELQEIFSDIKVNIKDII